MALPVVIIAEFKPPVVLAWQSDGAVVNLLAVYFVRLQFFARAEVMKASVNNREIIFCYFFLLFFISFSYYTYRSQKISCF